MSTRTKEEIEAKIKVRTADAIYCDMKAKAIREKIAALESELAALPKESVELVADIGHIDDFCWDIFAKDERHDKYAYLARIFLGDCKRNNIDPSHLARFITTYTFLPRLMELTFSEDGNWRPLSEPDVTHKERRDLARRYHDAMKGGAA